MKLLTHKMTTTKSLQTTIKGLLSLSFLLFSQPSLGINCFFLFKSAPTEPKIILKRDYHQSFSETDRFNYSETRSNLIWRKENSDRLREDQGELLGFVENLARASGLEDQLSVMGEFRVFIEKDPSNQRINANLTMGILTVSEGMLKLAETKEELAALLGHEFLHHSLGHSMIGLKKMWSVWHRFIPNKMARSQLVKTHLKAEQEVDEALPILLTNAGFDPMGIVNLNLRVLQLHEDSPRGLFGTTQKQELQERTQKILDRIQGE